MKYLKYDETTGDLTDANGTIYPLAAMTGLKAFDIDSTKQVEPLSTKEVLALKEQGFEAKDIIEMRKQGVI